MNSQLFKHFPQNSEPRENQVKLLNQIIDALGLSEHKNVRLSTPAVFTTKWLDYYELFRIQE